MIPPASSMQEQFSLLLHLVLEFLCHTIIKIILFLITNLFLVLLSRRYISEPEKDSSNPYDNKNAFCSLFISWSIFPVPGIYTEILLLCPDLLHQLKSCTVNPWFNFFFKGKQIEILRKLILHLLNVQNWLYYNSAALDLLKQ